MKRRCQSSHSREFISLSIGKFYHTNGHWWVRLHDNKLLEGWNRNVPETILKTLYVGDASTYGIIELDVEMFEKWIEEKKSEGYDFTL